MYDVFLDGDQSERDEEKIQITFKIKFQFSAMLNISVSIVQKRLIPSTFRKKKVNFEDFS